MASFTTMCTQLLDFVDDFDELPKAAHTTFTIDIQRKEIQSLWDSLKKDYHTSLHNATKKGRTSEDIVILKGQYKECFAAFVKCVAKMDELSSKSSNTLDSSGFNVSNDCSQIKLPPCDTDVFKGDYLLWPTFRDLFSALYISNTRLSPVEKLYHLIQKTSGEANEIVRKCPLTNDGFIVAWKNLVKRYDNKRILVNSQLKVLFNLKPVTVESSTGIKSLQRDINNCISTLEMYKIEVASWDAIFTYLCSSKLPTLSLALWEQTLNNKTEIPKWKDLDAFLTNRFYTLESVSEFREKPDSASTSKSEVPSLSNGNQPSQTSKTNRVNTYQTNTSKSGCCVCSSREHATKNCSRFLALSVSERFNKVEQQNLCINCLANSHSVKNCTSAHNCAKCQKRHHTLLHREVALSQNNSLNTNRNASVSSQVHTTQVVSNSENSQLVADSSSTSAAAESTVMVQSHVAISSRQVLLGTAMVYIYNNDIAYTARALIDPGSEGTFITERLQNLLKLPEKRVNAQVSGINRTVSTKSFKSVEFVLGSPNNSEIKIDVSGLVLPFLTENIPTYSLDINKINLPSDLKLADNQFWKSNEIDILIGADIYPFILLNGIRKNACGSLMAQNTVFGWIFLGPVALMSSNNIRVFLSSINDFSLNEDIPKRAFISEEEQFCENVLMKTTRRDSDGRYVVKLTFKSTLTNSLGYSKENAKRQFLRNEFRLLKSPELKIEYNKVVMEYLELGHMQQVYTPEHTPHYYLPHHAVFKPSSTTTKVRVVFNASCKTSSAKSLNDILHVGPSLQQDLTILLVKWRLFRYVFNGDLEKMYRQIRVHDSHTPFQRIIFRQSPSDPLQEYELKTVTFGVNCAPYLAIRSLIQLANDVENSLPLASNILKNMMYVDDALAGAHTITETLESLSQLIQATHSAGFTMRKWTSNCKEILRSLPVKDLLNEGFLKIEDCSSTKTLGIHWNAKLDNFFFTVSPFPEKPSYTKREVLSMIAKLFDPAGWLSPIVIVAKIFMQQLWLEKIEWDQEIPSGPLKVWEEFMESHKYISRIRISRWVEYSPSAKVQYHAFCDASEKAFGACVYIRVVGNDSCVATHLMFAKSRVAPIKSVSLPRLELCGATLLAEMIESLSEELKINKDSLYCWTDSTIVLAWLQKPPCAWNAFVANRVTKILEKTKRDNWLHVDSSDNPADFISRETDSKNLVENRLWWKGPSWLKLEESAWPKFNPSCSLETSLEQKAIKINYAFFSKFEDVLDRFSNFGRALRVLSYVLRFMHRRIEGVVPKNNSVTSDEIKETQIRLIQVAQKAHFASEYFLLSKKLPINSKSTIGTLNPFLDTDGLMKVGSRLSRSTSLSYNEKFPIIIPYSSQFTRLFVRFTHEITLHGGNQLMLRLIRQQFWIPRAKTLIRSTINTCKICLIHKKKAQSQIMAALPPERVSIARPFTSTGIDFCGPFEIKSYRGRGCRITKGYVSLFVCFATKAIHLEAVSDLTTPTFLAAFARFVARRGRPAKIFSDNGTNFVGASRALKKEFKEFIKAAQKDIERNYLHQSVEWKFIPPGAPHMGGLWEAGVKCFKFHFRRFAGNFKYTFEEFTTILQRIEACLNSRPISPLSDDPTDIEPLTPGHFLIGCPLLSLPEVEIDNNPVSIINRYQKMKAIYQHFCKRWKSEYLKELHKRNKWKFPQKDIEVNDLVVVQEEHLSPNEWRLGRVESVHRGIDNRVRVANIKTAKGVIKRPITELVLLANP